MADINKTSGDGIVPRNFTEYHITDYGYSCKSDFATYVVSWIIICTGIPLIIAAIAAVYSLVRNDNVIPIFFINLLISDLIQLCSMIVYETNENCRIDHLLYYFYCYGVMVSVGFMVCIALERYLVIAWPLWYRFRRTIKSSVVVCIVIWCLPVVVFLPPLFLVGYDGAATIYGVLLLLAFPLFIFFLVGTLKALTTVHSVPSDEKRRIVAILVVVLLIYTLLFLPSIIWCLVKEAKAHGTYTSVALTVLHLSPLADLSLYIFMRKGFTDKLLASLCCCVAVSQ